MISASVFLFVSWSCCRVPLCYDLPPCCLPAVCLSGAVTTTKRIVSFVYCSFAISFALSLRPFAFVSSLLRTRARSTGSENPGDGRTRPGWGSRFPGGDETGGRLGQIRPHNDAAVWTNIPIKLCPAIIAYQETSPPMSASRVARTSSALAHATRLIPKAVSGNTLPRLAAAPEHSRRETSVADQVPSDTR